MTVSKARRQYNAANRMFAVVRPTTRPCPRLGRQRKVGAFLFLAGLSTHAIAADPWEPFPASFSPGDFGGVGLLQTPTARFAPDGQITLGANHVQPYDRYFFSVQGMPWLEATLRLTTVRNRLYSPFPEFSGTQSFKDRGFDLKIRAFEETSWTPAVALGLRDFVGTGLFSSEYIVLNKRAGPIDVSFGLGWGNIASRGILPNPFRLIGSRFDTRGSFTAGGGTVNAAYFKGRQVSPFGGIKYDTPIKGLALKLEYDANDYKSEALGNRFRVRVPVNFGADYAVRSWLHLGAAVERGNKIALNLALTTNFNRPFRIPKFDAGPPAFPAQATTIRSDAAISGVPLVPDTGAPLEPGAIFSSPAEAQARPDPPGAELSKNLSAALGGQGAGLYAADFHAHEVVLYVAQARFENMATGLGRISRAAFGVLPARYEAISVVFVEGGMETVEVRVYRSALAKALVPGSGSPEELLQQTEFSLPSLDLNNANYQGPLSTSPPRFAYSFRPTLKTTLGRPEQFLLYQAGLRANGFLSINRHLNAQGAVAFALSDNFDKLQIPSDSQLPHVRSDIKDYLREGKTSIPILHANYVFNLAPALYGHVFGGLLEEMFGGVGAEILYRPATRNWAIGADLSYVKQRGFDQLFDFRHYSTVTGFVTGAYYFPGPKLDVRVRLGRYLAKDYGGTFEIARTFESGVSVGAFATKTNVSAERFGEGRFDKGIYLTVPLDAIYSRHVRGSIGLAYRPLIRDGGQMLSIPQQLLATTEPTIRSKFEDDWDGIDE